MQGRPVLKRASITQATGTWEILEGIWQDLPGLKDLQDLQLRNVQGLDRATIILFALKAMETSCLRSLDLRYKGLDKSWFIFTANCVAFGVVQNSQAAHKPIA
jgi:hypothetical protein